MDFWKVCVQTPNGLNTGWGAIRGEWLSTDWKSLPLLPDDHPD
jgi:hypothetical protein